jgi:hypothetical protein
MGDSSEGSQSGGSGGPYRCEAAQEKMPGADKRLHGRALDFTEPVPTTARALTHERVLT